MNLFRMLVVVAIVFPSSFALADPGLAPSVEIPAAHRVMHPAEMSLPGKVIEEIDFEPGTVVEDISDMLRKKIERDFARHLEMQLAIQKNKLLKSLESEEETVRLSNAGQPFPRLF